MLSRKPFGWLLLSTYFLVGCDPIPLPYLKKQKVGDVELTEDETPKQYCVRLAKEADLQAQRELGVGIALGIVGTGVLITGLSMGPDLTSTSWVGQNRNALFSAVGAALTLPAGLLIARSRDASAASAAAGQQITLDEGRDMMTKCLVARSGLVSSRSNLADAAQTGLSNLGKAQLRVIEAQATQAKQAADASGNPLAIQRAESVLKSIQAILADKPPEDRPAPAGR